MTAKTSAARRAAFFRALGETGNQTLAAERARVSRSWVSLHRAGDPAFRAELEAAVAAAKARLDGAAGVEPDAGWRCQAGEELTVRGTNGRWTQVARARLRQWTPRVEARFLAVLATCCNVKRACAAVELSQASAYNHRERWPVFAERWDAAIEEGYDRLDAALAASAGAMLGDGEVVPEVAREGRTVGEAIRLLGLHQRRAIGLGRAPGRRARVRSLEEVEASIIAKLTIGERAAEAGERRRRARKG